MLRYFLILLLIILIIRIVWNFLKGYSSGFDVKFKNSSHKKNAKYKNIEEANYTEIKDEEKTK